MKNRLKLFLNAMLMFIFIVSCQFAEGQAPVATIDYNTSGLVPGSTINVPLTLTGTEVGNFQFLLLYDRDVLSFVSAVNTISGYGFAGVSNTFTHTSLPGQVFLKASLAYTGGGTGATYSNQAVFTFTFIFNGGSTNITFANLSTTTAQTGVQYSYIKANPYNTINLSSVFTNGSLSGAYGTLTSVPAGGDWNTPATWQENSGGGTKVPSIAYNVIITGNDVTINPVSNTAKCHDLTVNSGGRLTLNFGKTLIPQGVFTINSSGSFVDQNTTSTLSATVKRNVTGNYPGSGNPGPSTIWHYVSAPTSNATIGTFLGCLMNKWTENSTGGTWDTLTLPLTLPLEVGRGYSVAAYPAFGDAVFTGPLNVGNKTISGLTNSNPSPGTGNGYYGYHLLGNPYASAVKWDAGIVRQSVDAAAYLWNGSTYLAKLPSDGYEIQAEQGFFVHATANGASVTIPNGNRVHSSGAYLKSSAEEQLTLTVSGNDLSDETSVRFNDLATADFDGEYDAYKLFGTYNCPQLFSMLPETNLAINSIPSSATSAGVQIGFKSGLSGTFTINASGMETFQPGTGFYLTDLFTGTVQNLAVNPVYSFTAYPANPEHRFNLHFSPVGIGGEYNQQSIRIFSAQNFVNVTNPTSLEGKITVYNLLGNEIAFSTVAANSVDRIALNVAAGYYLVKVVTEQSVVSCKVYIR